MTRTPPEPIITFPVRIRKPGMEALRILQQRARVNEGTNESYCSILTRLAMEEVRRGKK